MKTKFLFVTCATALLAACTNEEFVSTPEVDLSNRAKVEVTLGAEMGAYTMGDASTKTIWDKGDYLWEKGDMLGACLVDAGGSIAYNNIVTNYPFSIVGEVTTPVASANFGTNTAVYEGTYVFYHGYNTEMTKAKTLAVAFPETQEMESADKPYAHLTKDNFWVSPLIKIVDGIAYGKKNEIPVQFTSLYSGFAPTLKNTSTSAVKVSKIEVLSNVDNFAISGDLNTVTSAFGTAISSDAEDLTGKIEAAKNAMTAADKDLYQGTSLKGGMISITLPNIELAAGASQEVRMLFPAGQYVASDLTLKVFTDKGVFTVKVSDKAQNFTRDKFKTATYEMDKFEFPTNFDISTKKDWTYAAKFVNDNDYYKNKAATFTLLKAITLDSTDDIPAYSIEVKGAFDLILDKADATFNLVQESYIEQLEVAKGTSLNLGTKACVNTLTNNGTVNVLKGETVAQIATQATGWDKVTYGIFTLKNNAKIVVNGELQLNATSILAADSEIENNGTLAIKAAVTNNGLITNNGKLTVANGITLANAEDITLAAASSVACEASTATAIITNTGTITLADVVDVFKDKDGKATATSLVSGNGAVSVAITPASNLGELKNIGEVNSVTISGTWAKADIEKIDAATSVAGLILKGATVDVKDFVSTPSSETLKKVTTLTVAGDASTIKNSGTTATSFAILATALTINADATLTIEKNVQFGSTGTSVATITVLGNLVNAGAVAGDITVGAAAADPIPANTTASVENKKDAFLTATSAISTSNFTLATTGIVNFGTVSNYGTLHAKKVDNKIVGVSKFVGNITGSDDVAMSSVGF